MVLVVDDDDGSVAEDVLLLLEVVDDSSSCLTAPTLMDLTFSSTFVLSVLLNRWNRLLL